MPKNKLLSRKVLKDYAAAAMGGRNPNHGGGRGGSGSNNNNTKCRKHPKHKQPPGVCSVCLREKLSNLAITGSFTNNNTKIRIPSFSSSSSLSSLSSYHSSSSSSPYFPREKTSISSISSSLFKRRSSSLADADQHHHTNNKSHLGFWSKLMMNRRGKEIVQETFSHGSTSTTDHQTITTIKLFE